MTEKSSTVTFQHRKSWPQNIGQRMQTREITML